MLFCLFDYLVVLEACVVMTRQSRHCHVLIFTVYYLTFVLNITKYYKHLLAKQICYKRPYLRGLLQTQLYNTCIWHIDACYLYLTARSALVQ